MNLVLLLYDHLKSANDIQTSIFMKFYSKIALFCKVSMNLNNLDEFYRYLNFEKNRKFGQFFKIIRVFKTSVAKQRMPL